MKSIMKDKRGLLFKNAFFAIAVVSVAILAIGSWVGEWNTDYNAGLTVDLDNYDQLDNLKGEAKGQEGNISLQSSFNKGTDFEGTSLRGVFSILNDLYRPFRIVFGDGGMIDSLEDRWGLPEYVSNFLFVVMMFAITFAIIAIFFRKPGGQA